jgi:uncharacterized protein (DUF3084 family)
MDKTSEVILALKPVTFHYKNDTKRAPRFGLIAEDVAKVNTDLVAFDNEGKPFTVRYDQVNAMLLNEFLKDHKKVQEQQSGLGKQEISISKLEKEIADLTAQLKGQAAKIEEVSAFVETKRLTTKVALNNP